ncbi:MAG: hypothetical protein QN168_10880 [Armatimonadota bacterium]|nr:hypothetical protein [Armatimonadota bacterium]
MRARFSSAAAIEQGLATIQRIWVAEVVSAATVLWILPRLVRPLGGRLESGTLFIALFYLISLSDLALGRWFKSRAMAQAPRTPASSVEEAVGRLVGPLLLAVLLAVTPLPLAVVLYLLTGHLAAFAWLCALSLIGLLILRPRLEEWQEVAMRTPIHADRAP